MSVGKLKWLWAMSAPVCREGGNNTPKSKYEVTRFLIRRIGYFVKASRLIGSLREFMCPQQGSSLQRAMMQRPELVGAVIWPYICSSWDARTCLRRIVDHFRVIDTRAAILDFPFNDEMILLDLADISPGLRVVLDQPKWFMREGLLVINLFLLDIRIYSLAFSLAFENEMTVAYIGGIQGVDIEGVLDNYRGLTKALHGMRPRDFLVELFRIFCRFVKVSRIYAVDDSKRHHRSSYFGEKKSEKIFLNYNDVWLERGGIQANEDFYMLSIETPMKNMEEIPSKKRSMYKRRYDLLHTLEERMLVTFKDHPARCS